MKKTLLLLTVLTCALATKAVVKDFKKGIWPVTDKRVMKSLNGTWDLKVIEGFVGNDKTVPQKDATWGTIPVPGNWEQYGFCKPVYSFPDSVTGYYRTQFTVPQEWKGQRVCIRLDGVLRGYDLWLNGKHVGTWELPYNTCLFDLTPYLTRDAFKGGAQELAMRVYSHYQGYEFDCFDDWAPMGIFRDVTLFTVPDTHLSDLTVETRNDGTVNVRTEVANRTKHTSVVHEIVDAQGRVVSTGGKIAEPKLWTPETPYLYTLRLRVMEKGRELQTFEQKIGLREVKIVNGNVLTVNGQAVKFRGVTTHATDPTTVKVISDELTLKDLKLMKEASINYIRTSHYPREPRFFELCDSLGFYVMCEVPFGSRGASHLNDTAYYDNLRTRALATVDRHKNYPSVVIWSLGNENPFTKMCRTLGTYVKGLDSTRYICYPQKGGFKNVKYATFPKIADIYAPHYPNVSVIEERFKPADRPVIMTEYCHTLGVSFEDHDKMWDIVERLPNLTGGSVWEWVDQGMPFRKHRADRYGYEECVYTSQDGGFEMNGNKGTDGLLYADRTPLPNYYELQRNYAQAFVADSTISYAETSDGATVGMTVCNRYDFINLKDNVTFFWTLTADRDTVATGAFSPDCAPHSVTSYALGVPSLPAGRLAVLSLDVRNRQGLTLLRQAFRLVGDACEAVAMTSDAPKLTPMVRVGRKVTQAEMMMVMKSRIGCYLQPLDNPYFKGEVRQDGTMVSYTLTPCDTASHFLSELGVAYLLDSSIDRVQWVGQGPLASYPGRQRANRYGIWAMQKDDLYFEGNRVGVDACWLSDKDGNGVLISGDSLNINFEQTDRGIVVTVNVAVSGQGPKFNKTPYAVSSRGVGVKTGTFRMQTTEKGRTPGLFKNPADVPAAFRPFYTQYDTYLMRFEDITPTKQ